MMGTVVVFIVKTTLIVWLKITCFPLNVQFWHNDTLHLHRHLVLNKIKVGAASGKSIKIPNSSPRVPSMTKSGICTENLPHPDILCLPGLSVVSAGHPRVAVHPHRSDAGAGPPVHHPALRLHGGHPHASVRLCGRLRPGRALRPASQQPPVCLLGDRMPERAAVHRHPEAGLPP